MRIAVVGCGAMGSIYAGRLAAACHDVTGIDRWADHVEAMNRDGLVVSGPDGELRASVRAFTTAPEEIVDAVVLAVKASDVPGAAELARPMVGPETTVLTIQNGLGASDQAAEILGSERLAVGIASGFGASLRGPGRTHHNAMRAIRIGAHSDLSTERLEAVAAAFRSADFDTSVVEDIRAMQWEKLICNVAYSAPCAITGLTVGEVMADPHLSGVSEAAATEAWEIAKALGIGLDVADPVALVRDFGAQMPAAKPSALLDVEAGRISEIAHINGAIPREAAKIGRDAPVNATLTALVRARESAPADTPT